MPDEALTANDMYRLLNAHHFPSGKVPMGLLIKEIGSPCGKRRADAIYLPRSSWSPETIIGYEIKVSRSDLIVELNDPAKVDPWLQYCDQWWLVLPDPSLCDGLVIPDQWGILTPPSGRRKRTMTVIRPAPSLHPQHVAPALRRIVSHMMDNLVREIDGKKWKLEGLQRRYEAVNSELARLKQSGVVIAPPELTPEERAAQELIQLIKRDGNAKHVWWGGIYHERDLEKIARTVNDVELAQQKSRQALRMIENTIASVKRIVGPVENLDHQLEGLRRSIAETHESLFAEQLSLEEPR